MPCKSISSATLVSKFICRDCKDMSNPNQMITCSLIIRTWEFRWVLIHRIFWQFWVITACDCDFECQSHVGTSEKGSRIIWALCVYLENFNECNSSKLHTDDSGSCLVWYFQENTVTLATSISHGARCSMQNVSKSKPCPSGGDHTRKQENK